MIGWRKHPLRVTFRLVWLGAELTFAGARYLTECSFHTGVPLSRARARWLQKTARRVLRILNVRLRTSGAIPHTGLLVSNHLGYLDIVVLASLTPAAFVSKHEVKSWPVFGWFARLAGTVFVHRERRLQAIEAAAEIERALTTNVLLILFPEGTSSDGRTVLPFKSSLLEPAARNRHALWAGCIRYELDDGDPGEEVCYWKDMVLVPHLLNLLGKSEVRAFVNFTAVEPDSSDRKTITRQLHSEVSRLRAACLN